MQQFTSYALCARLNSTSHQHQSMDQRASGDEGKAEGTDDGYAAPRGNANRGLHTAPCRTSPKLGTGSAAQAERTAFR
eukprot:2947688-Pleurochrysis_carterae.AAC.3